MMAIGIILGGLIGIGVHGFMNLFIDLMEKSGPSEEEEYNFSWKAVFSALTQKKLNSSNFWQHKGQLVFLVLTGLCLGVTVTMFLGDVVEKLLGYILGATLLSATIVDLRTQTIPDAFSVILALVAVFRFFFFGEPGIQSMLLGMLVGGFFFYILALFGGMGGADVKLIAAGGLLLGFPGIVVGIFITVFSGALGGLFLLISGKKGRRDMIAFGPFIALGIWLSFFHMQQILDLYFRIIF